MKARQSHGLFFVLFSFPLTNDAFIHPKTFSFIMMSFLVRSLRDRLCMSRKAGPRGGGWAHPKDEKKNSMVVLAIKTFAGAGWAISLVLDLENSLFHLYGLQFQHSGPFFI